MQPPDTGSPAITLDLCRYNGLTTADKNQARLEWTPQGRIRVIDQLPGGENVVFDTPAGEVDKVRLRPGPPPLLTLQAAGQSVRLEYFRPMPTALPGETTGQYQQRAAGTWIPSGQWWVDELRARGVDARSHSFMKVFVLTVLITMGAVALFFLSFIVVAALS